MNGTRVTCPQEKGSEGGWEGCGPSFVSGLSLISGEELRTINSIKEILPCPLEMRVCKQQTGATLKPLASYLGTPCSS